MKIAFYAGSFDPFTVGHLHIIKTSAQIFDKVIVGLGVNSEKTRRFDVEKMNECIQKCLKNADLLNVECVIYDGLTIDEMKKHKATFLVRGLRNSKDYEMEENLAKTNKKLGNVETIFLRTDEYEIVSSTLVNQLKKFGKDYEQFVPKEVYEYISKI